MVAGALAASHCRVKSRLLHQSFFNHLHRPLLVGGEPGLLHLVRLVLPGQVGPEVVDTDEVAAGRPGPVQLQREDLVSVPASGGGQVLVLRAVVVVLRGFVVGVVRCVERAGSAPLAGSPPSSPSRCECWCVISTSLLWPWGVRVSVGCSPVSSPPPPSFSSPASCGPGESG